MPERFTNRCVHDLAWVIASPPLVSGEFTQTLWWDHEKCQNEFSDCLTALHSLDKNPKPLLDHLDNIKSGRLGHRFEALVSFWLSSISPNFKLIAQNIQINEIPSSHSKIKQRRTIGEVDFIIKDKKSGKIIHLEVAVKFYLGTEPFTDTYRWFGTNLNDQLGRKLDHLKQHQTQLLLNHPRKTPYTIDERYCLIKGRLFYPSGQNIAPSGVAKNHLRGYYLFQSEVSQGNNSPDTQLIMLKKNEWLSEFTQADTDKHKTQNSFTVLERPECYVVIENEKETQRVFCLPASFRFPSVPVPE